MRMWERANTAPAGDHDGSCAFRIDQDGCRVRVLIIADRCRWPARAARPAVMATLRNRAISLLRLAGTKHHRRHPQPQPPPRTGPPHAAWNSQMGFAEAHCPTAAPHDHQRRPRRRQKPVSGVALEGPRFASGARSTAKAAPGSAAPRQDPASPLRRARVHHDPRSTAPRRCIQRLRPGTADRNH